MNSRTWKTIPRITIKKLALHCFKSRASGTITRYLREVIQLMKFQVNNSTYEYVTLNGSMTISWFTSRKVKQTFYRRGQVVFMAKSSGDSCPAVLLDRYIRKANITANGKDANLFRSVIYLKSSYILGKKADSYSRFRELSMP